MCQNSHSPTHSRHLIMASFKCLPRKAHQPWLSVTEDEKWEEKKNPSALPETQATTKRYEKKIPRTPLPPSPALRHICHHAGKDIVNYPPNFTWHRHKGDGGNLDKFLRTTEYTDLKNARKWFTPWTSIWRCLISLWALWSVEGLSSLFIFLLWL